ncbi:MULTISPECIES: hypothetical protein [unclassified Caballeronia]|uniref:hypothetical protein n=1 Tax=unclassified Caballeronia TaxID=2646786 RepID=UPI0020282B46|nr:MULTISPECIES: hypothetical protein [unclassified Caballeronia]
MRRLLILVVSLLLSTTSLHLSAGADKDGDRIRHEDHRVLKVFDAQGKLIGRLASYGGYDGVFLSIDGALVFARVTRLNSNFHSYDSAKFQWSDSFLLRYPTPTCSGSPVIPVDTGPRPSVAVRKGADVTLLIAGDTDSVGFQIVAVLEGTNCHPPSGGGHYQPPPSPVPGFAAETSYPLTAHYPEPLTIRY